MIRPNFSYQSNDPLSTTRRPAGSWARAVTATRTPYPTLRPEATTPASPPCTRAKLGKTGRTITVDGAGVTATSQGTSHGIGIRPLSPVRPSCSDPTAASPTLSDYLLMRYLYNDTPSHNYTLKGNITYTEPVSKFAQVSAQYRASYEYPGTRQALLHHRR